MPRLSLLACLCLTAILPAAEKSVSLAYGPRNQLVINLNRNRFGTYFQPILQYSGSTESTDLEVGGRLGFLYTYTALSWKDFECRAQVGAGAHLARRMDWRKPPYEGAGDRWESSQEGVEVWIQPEFRFRERFALLLDAHFLRYLRETDVFDRDVHGVGFVTPDYSLGEVGFGIRYYLPYGGP